MDNPVKQSKDSFINDGDKKLCMEGALITYKASDGETVLAIANGKLTGLHGIFGYILQVADNIGINQHKRVRITLEEIE